MAFFHFLMRWLFNLRTLGIVLFVAAVSAAGVRHWQQPIEVKANFPSSNIKGCRMGAGNSPYYEIRTCRRQWPAHWVLHGQSTLYDSQNNKLAESTWENGVQHGPYRRFDLRGYQYQTGQFVNGLHDGRWRIQSLFGSKKYGGDHREYYEYEVAPTSSTVLQDYVAGELVRETNLPDPGEDRYQVEEFAQGKLTARLTKATQGDQLLDRVAFAHHERNGPAAGWHANGQCRYSGQWVDDRADGLWTLWDASGQQLESLKFQKGLLVERGGVPCKDFPHLAQSLVESFGYEMVPNGRRLQDPFDVPSGVYSLADFPFEARVQFDDSILTITNPAQTIEVLHAGLPMDAALYLLFDLFGFTLEYKYSQIWITTREQAKTWRHDRGLDHLTVAPSSALDNALESTTELVFRQTPFGDALSFLSDLHQCRIELDESNCQPGELANIPVTTIMRGIPLRAALATLADNHHLRVEIRNDVIVLLPGQTNNSAEPAR